MSLACPSGAVTAALKSLAAASQAQGAVKKRNALRVSGSEGYRSAPRGALRIIGSRLALQVRH